MEVSMTSHKSKSSSGDQPPFLKSEFKYVYHLQYFSTKSIRNNQNQQKQTNNHQQKSTEINMKNQQSLSIKKGTSCVHVTMWRSFFLESSLPEVFFFAFCIVFIYLKSSLALFFLSWTFLPFIQSKKHTKAQLFTSLFFICNLKSQW